MITSKPSHRMTSRIMVPRIAANTVMRDSFVNCGARFLQNRLYLRKSCATIHKGISHDCELWRTIFAKSPLFAKLSPIALLSVRPQRLFQPLRQRLRPPRPSHAYHHNRTVGGDDVILQRGELQRVRRRADPLHRHGDVQFVVEAHRRPILAFHPHARKSHVRRVAITVSQRSQKLDLRGLEIAQHGGEVNSSGSVRVRECHPHPVREFWHGFYFSGLAKAVSESGALFLISANLKIIVLSGARCSMVKGNFSPSTSR